MATQDGVNISGTARLDLGVTRSQAVCFALAPATGLALLTGIAAVVGLGAAGWIAGLVAVVGSSVLVGRAYRRLAMRPADFVTYTRVVLAAGVTALVVDGLASSGTPAGAKAWTVVGLAAVALVLDGVDGSIARRSGSATATGARFDMEADAYLIAVLSIGLAPSLGLWVLAIGLARYVFVLAAGELSWLNRPLPPSVARKAVAAQQGIVLTVAVTPIVPGWLAFGACVAALACLTWSFGRDTVWLARQDRLDRPAVTRVPQAVQTAVEPECPASTTRTSATMPAMAETAVEMR